MNNFRHFPKREKVVEILDEELAPHKYIFNSGVTADAESKLQAIVSNRSGSFIDARVSNDRLSETVKLNASTIKKYKLTTLDVPVRVVALIDELEEVRKPDEAGENDEGREAELLSELTFYFNA